MLIRFTKPWKWFKKGDTADIASGRADILCRSGLAEKATAETKAEAKTAKPKKKTRRRRKKIT